MFYYISLDRIEVELDPSRIEVELDPSRIEVELDPSRIEVELDPSRIEVELDPSRIEVEMDISREFLDRVDYSIPLDRLEDFGRVVGGYASNGREGERDRVPHTQRSESRKESKVAFGTEMDC
ncbi:hypothetical protein BgiMline_013784 [Biomphalaria glabrata]|nr:hypothetical protein BgiMline_012593 [Biomphalaria glabrata]